jgi:general secretion pathway protein L
MKSSILYLHKKGHVTQIQMNASGEILTQKNYSHLADLPAAEKGAGVIVIVPGEDILLTRVKIPKTNHRELLKAIPFALEEQLATDLNKLYFALGDFDTLEQLAVGVLDKEQFEIYLSQLRQFNVHADVLLPDYLAIPYKSNLWTVHIEKKRALVRTEKQAGFATDLDNLSMMLQLTFERSISLPHKIRIINKHGDIDDKFDKLKQNVEIEFIDNEKWACKELASQPAINLLQGKYRSKNKSSKLKTYWKIASITFAAWAIVLLGSQITELIYLNVHSKRLQKNIAAIYHQIFPGTHDVIEPEFRIKRELDNLSKSSRSNYFIALLGYVAPVLRQNPAIHLQSISYQDKQLTLQLEADKLSGLETFSHALTQQGLNVKQNRVDTTTKKIIAEIIIKRLAS